MLVRETAYAHKASLASSSALARAAAAYSASRALAAAYSSAERVMVVVALCGREARVKKGIRIGRL